VYNVHDEGIETRVLNNSKQNTQESEVKTNFIQIDKETEKTHAGLK